MLEPMRLGRLVIIGPYAFNFRAIVASGKNEGALIEVDDKEALLGNLVFYLKQDKERLAIGAKAEALARSEMAVLDRVYDVLKERQIL